MLSKTEKTALSAMFAACRSSVAGSGKFSEKACQVFAIFMAGGADPKDSGKAMRDAAKEKYPDYKKDGSIDKSRFSGCSQRTSWCRRVVETFEDDSPNILKAWEVGKLYDGLTLEQLYKGTLDPPTKKSDIEKLIAIAEKVGKGSLLPILTALSASEKLGDEAREVIATIKLAALPTESEMETESEAEVEELQPA